MSRKQREKEILTEKEENSLKEIFNSNNKVFISGYRFTIDMTHLNLKKYWKRVPKMILFK